MFFLLLLFAMALRNPDFSLEKSLQPISADLNSSCQNQITSQMKYSSLMKSLICGNPLTDPRLKEALKSSHLIHLVIISAGHFLWLDKVLVLFHIHRFLRLFIFSIYGFATLLQPPAFRFLAQRCLDEALDLFQLHLKSHQKIFLSAMTCLLVFPSWANSVSFLLSWGCALSLQLSGLFVLRKKNSFQSLFRQQLYFFLFLSPWMIQLGNWHPLQILSQFFLAPLFMAILFPLGILSLFFHSLCSYFDKVVDFILPWLMTFKKIQATTEAPQIPVVYFWIYLCGLHLGLHFFYVLVQRQKN